MKVWDGTERGRGRHRGDGTGPAGTVRVVVGPGGRGDPCCLIPVSLHSKQIVPGKDALCQSHSQINKQLYRVQIDICILFSKIVMFSEDKVFGFK